MAEPGRRDEQSQDYGVSSDTERGDAQQNRSGGDGRRFRSDGWYNFEHVYAYACMHV